MPDQREKPARGRRRLCVALGIAAAAAALAACAGNNSEFVRRARPPPQAAAPAPAATIGSGQVRVGLILPLSAPGNAGVAAQSMKNAAEMALAEFKNPNIQLLVKDDAGTPQGAQAGAQQALAEGAEIIVGPLFAQAVRAVGPVARQRGIPVIAFSTDASVAARGVYLLSFLPETDVKRIVDYAVSRGKRSFAALLPDNAYGAVVEAAFQQEVARRRGRVVALEKYPLDPSKIGEPARRVAQAADARRLRFSFPTAPTRCRKWCRRSPPAASTCKRVQLLGTGLWDDPRMFSTPTLNGGWYAAPESSRLPQFLRPLPRALRARTRCARRRSPMTRWRWSPRW